jgi:hypothetical protein
LVRTLPGVATADPFRMTKLAQSAFRIHAKRAMLDPA